MRKRRNKLRIKALRWLAPAENRLLILAVDWVAK